LILQAILFVNLVITSQTTLVVY